MGELVVGTAAAAPGRLTFGEIRVGRLADAAPVVIPVMILRGRQDGPALMVSAAIHGPEITGTEVIRRLCREIIDPQTLRGTIVALPIANPFAYRAASWTTPEDGYNLNRTFPGDPRTWLSMRVANLILEHVVRKVQYIVDLHCMCEPSILFSHVHRSEHEDVYRRARGMAEAFGLGIIEQDVRQMQHRAGSLLEAAAGMGIPGITPELQAWRRVHATSVDVGVRGVLNVMRLLEMTDGAVEPQPDGVTVPGVHRWVEIFSNEGGLVEFSCAPGQPVRTGQPVARIRDPFGEVLEEVSSPVDGFLVGYPVFGNQAVRTGELLVFIGTTPR